MLKKSTRFFLSLFASWVLSVAYAENIHVAEFNQGDAFFTAIKAMPKNVSLHWKDSNGSVYKSFSKLEKALSAENKEVLFIMNAGIYSDNDKPAGVHIENGVELNPLNLNKGKGNFHLQPNGVFYIDTNNTANVVTSRAFAKLNRQKIKLATQSGPMLIIDGKINPIFKKNIKSNHHRNGVCITSSGELWFWITDLNQGGPVNFYQFASAGIALGCQQALYLDGSISKIYLKNKKSLFHFPEYVGLIAITINNK